MLSSTTSFIKEYECPSTVEPADQTKIRIADTYHVYYINTRDIVRIQSLSNYSKIFFTSGKSILVCKVLAYFDALLTDLHFVRIHRTHLVNLLFIKQYEPGRMPRIGLNNNEVLPVSRRKKKIVRHEMKMLGL